MNHACGMSAQPQLANSNHILQPPGKDEPGPHRPELFVGGVHGDDEARVYAELCEVVDEWIEVLHKDRKELPAALAGQKEFSGKFVLRVEPALHRRLAAKAIAAGESLNSYCVKALTKA